jgi:hypothetical protein
MANNLCEFKDVTVGDRVGIESYEHKGYGTVRMIAHTADDHSVEAEVLLDRRGLRFWRKAVWFRPYQILVLHKVGAVIPFTVVKDSA